MHPVQAILIIGITSLVLVSAMLLVIRKMPSKPGVGWWLTSSLIAASAYTLALIFIEEEPTAVGEGIFIALQIAAHSGLAIGALLFFNQKIHKPLCLGLLFTATTCTYLSLFLGHKFLAEITFVSYLATIMFYVAYRLINLPHRNKSINTTAFLYFAVGIHWLDYPFLKYVEWFAPIGFLIGVILGMFLGLSLALLALLQFEKQTKESEQRAIYAATHDPLTGLYNRSYMGDLFNIYTKEAKGTEGSFLMMYLDLDGFKAVNDTHGHKAGDVLLQVIAKRLTNLLKERGDSVRIGGDEIIIMCKLRKDKKDDYIYSLARQVLDVIEQPIADKKNIYNVSASIGVCCYPRHGTHLEKLMEQADALMYAAKEGGRRQIKFADFSRKVSEAPAAKLQSAPILADIA